MLSKGMKNFLIGTGIVIGAGCVLAGLTVGFYLKGLPYIVSNEHFINYVEDVVTKQTGAEFDLDKPVLVTHLNPQIQFKANKISLRNKKANLFDIENLDTEFSFAQIFDKKLIINKVVLDYFYADVNKILDLPILKQEKKEQQKSDFIVDIFHSYMAVKNAVVVYRLDKTTNINVNAKNVGIDDKITKKKVKYNVVVDITKGKEKLHIVTSESRKIIYKKFTSIS